MKNIYVFTELLLHLLHFIKSVDRFITATTHLAESVMA